MPFLAPQVRHRRLARNAGRAGTKTIGAPSDAAQFVPRVISFTDRNSKTALQRSCAGADGLRVRRKRALIARFVLPGKVLAVAETSLSKGRTLAGRLRHPFFTSCASTNLPRSAIGQRDDRGDRDAACVAAMPRRAPDR
ncbi:hypothetical protein [Burkholderia multivorans]|jgi:hypothetical protein|uniref:hypothetical protein n=1 Tax=Burkholderia multivorans TaxID=87883 RepID=UPI00057CE343|nr:hypothetical protein [Burkholderia multivorans]KHS16196.1 hypothetical protein BMD20_07120 [Burkholderia multivorans]KHS20650.1 hypothetical protein BMD22_03500 [Burkholderia multivorans]MBR7921558.1 hypothetical protein [Burkholderia multivorans]MBR8105852.1 hypothetical protein [Burkholderia multivorans]MBR8336908.1 hypothetical protein [Burkholderia multivorans]